MSEPGMGHRAGHSPDHTRGLVLGDDAAASRDDAGGAAGAVATHPGEDERESAAAPDRSGGREQRIDGGLAEIDRRPVIERNDRIAVATHDPHVAPATRQVDAAGADDLAIARLAR